MRFVDASVDETAAHKFVHFSMTAIDLGRRRPWTVKDGQDLDAAAGPAILLNPRLAEALHARPADIVSIRVSCVTERAALPPVTFRVSGIAEFPFDDATWLGGAASSDTVMTACGGGVVPADMILVASRESFGADAAVAAIRRVRPDLHPVTNEEIVTRMQQQGFTYFRQICGALDHHDAVWIPADHGVADRVGEPAARGDCGAPRPGILARTRGGRCVLAVGAAGRIGGVLALPLGFVLALWLDRILKAMPQIPATLHFFVFEPRALVWQAILLVVTAVLAALYPIRLVVTLPISATLRNEVIG